MTDPSVLFDTKTGRLQLDRVAFEALAGWVNGDASQDEQARRQALASLEEAGVVTASGEQRVHPLVADALRVIANPRGVLELSLGTGVNRRAVASCWFDDDIAAVLVSRADFSLAPHPAFAAHDLALFLPLGESRDDHPPREPEYELLSLHPSFLPAALARLIGLGPRGQQADPLAAVPGGIAAGPDSQTTSAAGFPAQVSWGIVVRWSAGSAPVAHERRIQVDGSHMELSFDPDDSGRRSFVAVTPTEVWRALTGLLPIASTSRDG